MRGTSSPQTGHTFAVLSLLLIALYWLSSGHNANIHLLSEKEISHGRVSWQTLNLYRNGAIGFIDWLDVPVVSPTNVKPVFFHISKNQIVAVKFLPINLHHRIRSKGQLALFAEQLLMNVMKAEFGAGKNLNKIVDWSVY